MRKYNAVPMIPPSQLSSTSSEFVSPSSLSFDESSSPSSPVHYSPSDAELSSLVRPTTTEGVVVCLMYLFSHVQPLIPPCSRPLH